MRSDLDAIKVKAQEMAVNSKVKKWSLSPTATAQEESKSADAPPSAPGSYLYCGNCGKAPSLELTLKRCKQCHMFYYCSAACQKQHWPTHKPYCLQVRNSFVKMMGPDTRSVKGKYPSAAKHPRIRYACIHYITCTHTHSKRCKDAVCSLFFVLDTIAKL